MKARILLALSLILSFSGFVFAQQKATKTVTNADLEKFRQRRLQAEKEYRENYRKRGMPSPEEIERIESERQRGLDEFAREAQQRRAQAQGDIRQRAADLKREITSIEAQLAYVRREYNTQQRSRYAGGTVWSPYSLPNGCFITTRRRIIVLPPAACGNNTEQDELKTRLTNLEQILTGLYAQWNELEDEARRAGVKID